MSGLFETGLSSRGKEVLGTPKLDRVPSVGLTLVRIPLSQASGGRPDRPGPSFPERLCLAQGEVVEVLPYGPSGDMTARKRWTAGLPRTAGFSNSVALGRPTPSIFPSLGVRPP